MKIRASAFVPAPIEDVFDFVDDPANILKLGGHAAEHVVGSEISQLPDGRRVVDLRMRAGTNAWVQTVEQVIRERPTRLVTRGGTWTKSREDFVMAVTTDRHLSVEGDGTRLVLTAEYRPGKPSLMATVTHWLQRRTTRLELERQLHLIAEHFPARGIREPAQMEEVQRRWDAWVEIPYPSTEYPPGSLKGEVAGIDLALLDGDAAAAVSDYLDPSLRGDPTGISRRLSLADLEKVVPLLTEPGRTYFEPLLEMLRLVQAAWNSADKPPLSSDIPEH